MNKRLSIKPPLFEDVARNEKEHKDPDPWTPLALIGYPK
jgi:hypothetical protein